MLRAEEKHAHGVCNRYAIGQVRTNSRVSPENVAQIVLHLFVQKFRTISLDSSEVQNYNIGRAESSELLKGGCEMTDMRRVTISLPDELDKAILELRKDSRFVRCSYAEIVRTLLERGLEIKAQAGE